MFQLNTMKNKTHSKYIIKHDVYRIFRGIENLLYNYRNISDFCNYSFEQLEVSDHLFKRMVTCLRCLIKYVSKTTQSDWKTLFRKIHLPDNTPILKGPTIKNDKTYKKETEVPKLGVWSVLSH